VAKNKRENEVFLQQAMGSRAMGNRQLVSVQSAKVFGK